MESNLLMPVWAQWVVGILVAVLVLLAMITIHEFGHYLVGKLLHFKIDEFSVGFGPAIFKRKNKRTGELFAVRIIPLGGYCAFHGEDGLEEDEATVSENPPSETISEENAAPMSANGGDETKNEPPVSENQPPKTNPKPEKKDKRRNELWTEKGDFVSMKPWKRILVLIAGAAMNYLLALVLILIGFGATGQSMVVVRGVEPSDTYASELSLSDGDILIGGGGRNFYLTNDVARAVNNKKTGDIVEFRVARKTETGYEETVQKVVLRADVSVKNSTDFTNVWKALGVAVEEREDASSETGYSKYYMVGNCYYRFGFFETVGRSFAYSFRLAGSILGVIGELLTGKLGIKAVGGPVTTITMTAQVAMGGFRDVLEIAALIGVNLAVFNLLPIPALDGSKVVFTLIEWIRGKPISRKIEAIIHAVGFVLLFGFAILVDILQYV